VLIKIVILALFVTSLNGAIDPPNYDFSMDSLSGFMPGNMLEAVESKYGKAEQVGRQADLILHRVYVSHQRYKIPVYVQTYNGKILDFAARLPSYFLHDVFHQSLINRFRKQDKFFNRDKTAIYYWNDREGTDITYSGACTITCFPIFVAAKMTNPPPTLIDYRSITQQLVWSTLF
jgi:hypothetical protein